MAFIVLIDGASVSAATQGAALIIVAERLGLPINDLLSEDRPGDQIHKRRIIVWARRNGLNEVVAEILPPETQPPEAVRRALGFKRKARPGGTRQKTEKSRKRKGRSRRVRNAA